MLDASRMLLETCAPANGMISGPFISYIDPPGVLLVGHIQPQDVAELLQAYNNFPCTYRSMSDLVLVP